MERQERIRLRDRGTRTVRRVTTWVAVGALTAAAAIGTALGVGQSGTSASSSTSGGSTSGGSTSEGSGGTAGSGADDGTDNGTGSGTNNGTDNGSDQGGGLQPPDQLPGSSGDQGGVTSGGS